MPPEMTTVVHFYCRNETNGAVLEREIGDLVANTDRQQYSKSSEEMWTASRNTQRSVIIVKIRKSSCHSAGAAIPQAQYEANSACWC